MAQKRMFSLKVVDTDCFIDMPISSRLLYYELNMRADDDGFVDSVKKILAFTGLKDDDLKILIAKKYIIPFESGVIVIRHWRMNNYLQNDRYTGTIHTDEKQKLSLDKNNVYIMYTECIHSIDKNSIVKNSKDILSDSVESDYACLQEENSKIPFKDIIEYLNELAGTQYRYKSKATQSKIKARYNEGFAIDDFKTVISKKCAEWKNTEMAKYLRPETLFSPKFEGYLNQKVVNQENKTLPDWYKDQSNINTGIEDFDETELENKLRKLRGETQ